MTTCSLNAWSTNFLESSPVAWQLRPVKEIVLIDSKTQNTYVSVQIKQKKYVLISGLSRG